MKATILILTTLALAGLTTSYNLRTAEEVEKNEPIFVKSLKKLHRGPPKQVITSRANIQTEWITQKLDHFDSSETRTWQMVMGLYIIYITSCIITLFL